jgi:uncharacterized protein (DUF2062 family)
MVFKRRKQLTWAQAAREAVYPKTGWRRAFEYVGHRLRRLPDTAHKIAVGIACGVFVSFSPLFGLHFLYAGILALMLRGNVLAALLGTFFGNPLTFPFIAAISYQSGLKILGFDHDPGAVVGLKDTITNGIGGLWSSLKSLIGMGQAQWSDVGAFFVDVLWPYYIGGIPTGIVAGTISYLISRPLVSAYQNRRRRRLKTIADKRKQKRDNSAADAAE